MEDKKYTTIEPPPWATVPPTHQKWTLLEIKDGVVVQEHDISNRSCTVIGRSEDVAHIVQHHASISRQHARLAFDSSGTLWFRDLSSTHGVLVNKKQLPKQSIGKLESMSTEAGSRGVVLNPGDIFQIGASTRLFTVEIQSQEHVYKEKEDVNSLEDYEHPDIDDSRLENRRMKEDQDSFVARNDEAEDGKDRVFQLPLDGDSVPEIYRKEWYKIQELTHKLENIRQESDRIQMKESTQEQLTTGQERQLERNQERMEQLELQIEERTAVLYNKLNPDVSNRRDGNRKRKTSLDQEYDDEDDSFFDRTLHQRTESANNAIESEETLLAKWRDLFATKERLRIACEKASTIINEFQGKLENLIDGEDAFFLKNDLSLAAESQKKIKDEIERTEMSLLKTQQLLRITSPRIDVDVQTGKVVDRTYQTTKSKRSMQTEESAVYRNRNSDKDRKSESKNSLHPNIQRDDSQITAISNSHRIIDKVNDPEPSNVELIAPFLNEKVIPRQYTVDSRTINKHLNERGQFGCSMPPPSFVNRPGVGTSNSSILSSMPPPQTMQEKSAIGDTNSKWMKKASPPLSTLQTAFGSGQSTITFSGVISSNGTDKESSDGKKRKQRQIVTIPLANAIIQSDETANSNPVNNLSDSWQAPTDQDGSGFTKLNTKYLGRY